MPSGDFLELNDVLYVNGLTKNLLLVSSLRDIKCMDEFNDKQVIITGRRMVNSCPKGCDKVAYTGCL